jgi:hypothetical protein
VASSSEMQWSATSLCGFNVAIGTCVLLPLSAFGCLARGGAAF